MSPLFKRVTLPLLAVVAAIAFATPARAATAAWVYCQGDINTFYGWREIANQVQCVISDTSTWAYSTTHFNLLGGGDDNPSRSQWLGYTGPGDFYDPASGYWNNVVHSNGTYNCWAICDGGNSGGAWYASTGGTYYVTF